MFYHLLSYSVYVVALATCGLAFWLGDRALKWAAVATIFFWSITPIVSQPVLGWNMPVLIVDTNATLVMTWISLRRRSLWSAMLAALALLQVLMPFVSVVDPHIRRFYWMSAYNVLGYLFLVVLLAATWLTVQARRRADEGAVRP